MAAGWLVTPMNLSTSTGIDKGPFTTSLSVRGILSLSVREGYDYAAPSPSMFPVNVGGVLEQ